MRPQEPYSFFLVDAKISGPALAALPLPHPQQPPPQPEGTSQDAAPCVR
jgi:hypothetical protein